MGDQAGGRRFSFAFAASYRLPALMFGITPATAGVLVDDGWLRVRFGPWRPCTPRTNISECSLTGDFSYLRTAGPARLSFADRGVTFATNPQRAICVRFRLAVPALDPTGRLLHPGATMTVAAPQALFNDLTA